MRVHARACMCVCACVRVRACDGGWWVFSRARTGVCVCVFVCLSALALHKGMKRHGVPEWQVSGTFSCPMSNYDDS